MMMLLSLLLLLQTQKTVAPEYVVGAQDRLAITVFDEPTLTKTVTIDADGTFDFPLIGRVRAAGLTVRQIEEELKKRLGADYLVSPQVSIEVETYRSQVVYVQGQVRSPGFVPLKGAMTVMDALAQAGSTTSDAGNFVEVYRRPAGDNRSGPVDLTRPAQPPLRLSMSDLRSGRAQDVMLRDGDTVLVPKAETFIVTGFVRNPSTYVLDGEVTVQRAIALAGGPTERGAVNRTTISRLVNGKIEKFRARMTDLVRPNDTINVPQRIF